VCHAGFGVRGDDKTPTHYGPSVSHPVVKNHADVDLDFLAALKGLQGLPLGVGGAVGFSVVGAALSSIIGRETAWSSSMLKGVLRL